MSVPLRLLFAIVAAALTGAIASTTFDVAATAALAATFAGIAAWLGLALIDGGSPVQPTPAIEPPAPQPAFERLIEAIDDPLLIVRGQQVELANRAALGLLGQHIVGDDVRLAIRHPAATERLGRASRPDQPPIELVGIDERERRWELTVQDIGAGAQLVRLRDRTDSHTAERMRVDFVANASHELRTPLATLLGFIETLQDGKAADDESTRSRFLKIMFGEAKRMQRLVNDLMSLSRIEAEKYSLPQSPVALEPLAEEVAAIIRSGLRERPERIVVQLTPGLPPVPGDRVQLSQLLHNLINNALKYGRADTPVTIRLAPATAGMLRLSVADEGEGIAPEHLPRITERFYRVDPSRSRQLGGTGLGLSIVKHIVERHRGRLDIESVVGKGTTVSILLPPMPVGTMPTKVDGAMADPVTLS